MCVRVCVRAKKSPGSNATPELLDGLTTYFCASRENESCYFVNIRADVIRHACYSCLVRDGDKTHRSQWSELSLALEVTQSHRMQLKCLI